MLLLAWLPDRAGACLPAFILFKIGGSGQGAGAWKLPRRAAGDPRAGESKTGAVWNVDFKLSSISGLFKNQLGKYL